MVSSGSSSKGMGLRGRLMAFIPSSWSSDTVETPHLQWPHSMWHTLIITKSTVASAVARGGKNISSRENLRATQITSVPHNISPRHLSREPIADRKKKRKREMERKKERWTPILYLKMCALHSFHPIYGTFPQVKLCSSCQAASIMAHWSYQ